MNGKWFTVGSAVGIIVAAPATTWFLRGQQRCKVRAQSDQDQRLQLVEYTEQTGNPEILDLLKELRPVEHLYMLRFDGQDAGAVSLGPDGIEEVFLISPSAEHTVTVSRTDNCFPGEISVAANQPGGRKGIWTVQDLDLDGIPDRRMDWKAKQMFDLESITWKPRPRQQRQKK